MLAEPKIIEFLLAIFENRPKAFYNETYLSAPQRSLHRDSDSLEIAKPGHFAGVWIALEDIAEGSGELECLVGSHRSASGFRGPHETDTASNAALYIEALKADAERFAQTSRRFILKKGDLLVLHPDLAYQDSDVSVGEVTRRSLLTYFMPFHEEPHCQGSLHFKGLATAGCHFISQFSDVPSV